MSEDPGKCDAAISFAIGRGATFTCDRLSGHSGDHYHVALFLRVEWTDEHRKAFRPKGEA